MVVDNFEIHKKAYDQIKKEREEKKQQEALKKSDQAYKELMGLESDVKSSKGSSSKKKPKKVAAKKKNSIPKKATKPLSNKQNQCFAKAEISSSIEKSSSAIKPYLSSMMELNSPTSPSKYRLHPRVLRWQTLDLKKIRKFQDLDENKNPIHSYEQMKLEDLKLQKAYHNLIGLERIFNFPDLLERYSFTYTFKTGQDETAKNHRGRSLFADLLSTAKAGRVF